MPDEKLTLEEIKALVKPYLEKRKRSGDIINEIKDKTPDADSVTIKEYERLKKERAKGKDGNNNEGSPSL